MPSPRALLLIAAAAGLFSTDEEEPVLVLGDSDYTPPRPRPRITPARDEGLATEDPPEGMATPMRTSHYQAWLDQLAAERAAMREACAARSAQHKARARKRRASRKKRGWP